MNDRVNASKNEYSGMKNSSPFNAQSDDCAACDQGFHPANDDLKQSRLTCQGEVAEGCRGGVGKELPFTVVASARRKTRHSKEGSGVPEQSPLQPVFSQETAIKAKKLTKPKAATHYDPFGLLRSDSD